ncbi:hypothetical protein N431DRAFT_236388 [Stipitochalara longipes BDJ]|nr:hypothetical protein N431DRAFT_236388 [Stipitochalara longipes BDJ]
MAMGSLARTLDSLQLRDGQPDIEARRRELDGLLPHLTASEVRRLKIQLNNSANDICLELPLELLLCITQHLELEEVITLRSVSRKWNDTFSGDDFCLGIIKTHFRPVWEKYNRCSNADQKLVQKEALIQWLPEAIRGRIRRQHGQYHSMSILRWDGRMNSDWQYMNGRIACRNSHSTISVIDIRTSSMATYVEENRLDFGIWHLSDDYLLAAKNGPISLSAWPLTYPPTRSHESIRLPARVLRISAQKDQVGIVDTAYQVLIWTVGGPLRSVDTSILHESISEFRIGQGLVVFHPLNESCIFVVYEAWSKHFTITKVDPYGWCRVIVQEYVEGRAAVTKFLDLNSLIPGPLKPVGLVHDHRIEVHRSFLAQTSTGAEPSNGRLQSHGISGQTTNPDISPKPFIIVTFDIYQKKFISEEYYIPIKPQIPVLERVCQWRNQIFYPLCGNQIDRTEHMPAQGTEDSLIAINKHHLRANPHIIPCYRFQNSSPCYRPAGSACNVAYYWAGHSEDAEDATVDEIYHRLGGTNSTRRNVIQRDDDFVVLRRSDGWAVWCFDREVQLLGTD